MESAGIVASSQARVTALSAALIRSGVNGTVLTRVPVASKMALAIAAGTGQAAGSPAPTGRWSGRLTRTISTSSGASAQVRIGEERQSRLVARARSDFTSSLNARL